MPQGFKNIYDMHRWLRYGTWIGLFCAMLFLLWASGGLPPQAWMLFGHSLMQFSRLWDVRGPFILLPLLGLLMLSLIWLVAWGLLGWMMWLVVRIHWSSGWDKLYRELTQRGPSRKRFQWPLLVSTAGGQMMVERPFNNAMSMLRLPQRYRQEQHTPVPAPGAYRQVEDMPTRPVYSLDPVTPANLAAALPAAFPLSVGIGWDVGITRRRSPNEDSVLVLQGSCTYQGQLVPFGLFVVADGMGGHANGREASRLAMQSMLHTVLQNIVMGENLSDERLVDMVVGGVEWANLAIYYRTQESGQDMGTTLTAALLLGKKAYVVNVGDSRTYLYREGSGLKQISRDHSLVATLVAFGEIAPEDIYTHPERNKVYRSLGHKEQVEVDWFVVDLCKNDRLLLCSDGLWEMVRDPDIARLLGGGYDPIRASEMLVQAALRGGGSDNISVVVVRVP